MKSSTNIIYAELGLTSNKAASTWQFKDDKVIYSTIHTNVIPPPIPACKVRPLIVVYLYIVYTVWYSVFQ